MILLKEISQKDIGISNGNADISYKLRKAARAMVVNKDNRIAILNVTKDKYHKLPGGGFEGDEDVEEALRREVMEEVGAEIEIQDEVGCTIEYRDEFRLLQISYCYIARIVGALVPVSFTELEISDGFELQWYSIEEAIEIMESDQPQSYVGKFIHNRDIIFLKESQKIFKLSH